MRWETEKKWRERKASFTNDNIKQSTTHPPNTEDSFASL